LSALGGPFGMLSVIVPAHNEEAVIARGLRAIVTGAAPGEIEVIVACNGCTDGTADLARQFGPPVHVLEIEQASKTAALNAAEELASGFPRFYVDADVVIDLPSIRRMAAVLEAGPVLMANPELHMDLSRTTWPVRAFYRVWTALPYNRQNGMVGTGVYALSRAGRARFECFPDVIADDGFVRYCFAPYERTCVRGALSRVAPPHGLGALLRIKTRSRLGKYQLRQTCPDRPAADRRSIRLLVRALLRRPHLWLLLPVYVAVNVCARIRASRRVRAIQAWHWARDDSRIASVDASSGGAPLRNSSS